MGRIKSKSLDPRYQAMLEERKARGENRDCTVISIALVCEVSYQEAWGALDWAGRKPERGANIGVIALAIKKLGFDIEKVKMTEGRVAQDRWGDYFYTQAATEEGRALIDTYPKAHRILKTVTTHHPRRFPKQFKAWTGDRRAVMITTDHAAAYIDGEVVDHVVNRAQKIDWMFFVSRRED